MPKYYYGDSVKDALSHDPVTIRSIKQLKGYEENYNVVIPADEVERSK